MKTEKLTEKLDKLDRLSSELDIPGHLRLKMMEKVSDYVNEFISGLPGVTAFREKEPASLTIGDKKRSLSDLLTLYREEVAKKGINAASGGHLGYIPGGGIFASAMADFLAASTNPFAGIYFASPGAATIENEVVSWLKKLFSFPESAVGNLTSGGSLSNLIAFTAARDRHGVKNELIRKSVVYMSRQVHHSVYKALRIIGLEDIAIRHIPLDGRHRMKADMLAEMVGDDRDEGLNPFMVVATAGTTDTGAVDPLDEIAAIAEKNGMWYHVDAAYGGFFILTSRKELFRGIERADSLVVDPHKGLFLPYGTGAVLVKDKLAVLHSQYYEANYMQDASADEMILSPANLSPELTRHFRGLRVWLPLNLHGIEPFRACLEEKLLLTEYFRRRLQELGFILGPEPDLSVSYFWYPFKTSINEKNRQLMKEIHADGSVFLSSSIIDDRFVIRMAILAFRTKKGTIDRAMEMIKKCLAKVMESE